VDYNYSRFCYVGNILFYILQEFFNYHYVTSSYFVCIIIVTKSKRNILDLKLNKCIVNFSIAYTCFPHLICWLSQMFLISFSTGYNNNYKQYYHKER